SRHCRKFEPPLKARSGIPPPEISFDKYFRAFSSRANSGTRDFHLHGPALALPPLRYPGAQSFGETLRRQSKANFHFSITERQRVVEFSGVREVPHAKLI